ncbi:hypothetical protein V6N13_044173 [Hibiscus sabdariffa]
MGGQLATTAPLVNLEVLHRQIAKQHVVQRKEKEGGKGKRKTVGWEKRPLRAVVVRNKRGMSRIEEK